MLEVGQIDLIRQKIQRDGWSIRRTARELRVCRNTVRKYTRGEAEPRRREVVPRERPVRDLIGPVIEEIYADWASRTTRKQRLTAPGCTESFVSEATQSGSPRSER